MRKLEHLNIQRVDHLALQLGLAERHLRYLANSNALYYPHTFIDKKGKERHGFIPKAHFRPIADKLKVLVQRIHMPSWLHGGIPDRSAIGNAKCHIGKHLVFNLDLKSFYPSVHRMLAFNAFRNIAGCSPDVASILTKLSTFDNQLPQGSPPSAFIAAMVSIPMGLRLRNLALQHGASYSQYVDDITISGGKHLARLERLIEEIVCTSGFILHAGKRKRLYRHEEQTVTGCRVNFHLDAPISMYENVTDDIEDWERGAGDRMHLASLQGKLVYIQGLCSERAAPLQQRLELAVSRDSRTTVAV